MATYLCLGTVEGTALIIGSDGEWTIGARGLRQWEVTEVAITPSVPGRIFAGTRGDGVWVSQDYGKSWSKPSYGRPGPGKVQCLTIAPDDHDTLWVGGEPIGIWVSRDAGKNWEYLDSVWKVPQVEKIGYPVAVVEPHVRDISFAPDDPMTLYAALQVGSIIKSVDGGASWEFMEEGFDADVHTIVPTPGNPARVYLATGGHDNRLGKSNGRALFCSENRGVSWSPLALDFEQEYSVPLIIAPEDETVLYSAVASGPPPFWQRRESGAETAIIRSRDAGKTWQRIETGFSELARDFPVAIAADEVAAGHVYLGTNGGNVYHSSDGGDSWEKLGVTLPGINDIKVTHV